MRRHTLSHFVILITAIFWLVATTAFAGERRVTFRAGALIEVNFLAVEASARATAARADDYYHEVGGTVTDAGGEILGVFDVYQVSNGMVHPQSVGVVQWPGPDSFRTFKREIDRNGLGVRTQVWRNFYRLDGDDDITVTFNSDKVYEFVTLVLNPLGADKMAAFASAIMPLAGRKFTRTPLITLLPVERPGAGLRPDLKADRAHIVQWDNKRLIRAWMEHAQTYTDSVRDLLDPAVDRRELIWTQWLR
ncbi:MAG: hypothetical protein ACE5GZ_07795 [Gammaproteobacteria bacterium]